MKANNEIKGMYEFRPSARLIHTIGDQIIKDIYASIVELVKNAYDADAKKAELRFLDMSDSGKAKIIISDDGHGMDFETVINKWMIPATEDKADRKKSHDGRNLQGRKGIGRFAAAILGDTLSIETTDRKGNTTIGKIDWSVFKKGKYLDSIEIPIESKHTGRASGTTLIVEPKENTAQWTEEAYRTLITELRKLVSPIKKNEDFDILLELKNIGVEKFNNLHEKIEPFPLIDLFDYRLHGTVDGDGNALLVYENQAEKNIPSEKFRFKVSTKKGKYCGPLKLDLRVFDRDPDALDNLIRRGLKDPATGNFLGKKDARNLLNENCGISVYRDNFRIRPYGNAGYDWLELDKLRVQNPSFNIGVDQIIGIVNIESEEVSRLEEKSARDGLKENDAYFALVEILKRCLEKLEERRFDFRRKTGRGRKSVKIEKELDALFDFGKLKKTVKGELKKSKVPPKVVTKVEEVITKTEVEKAKTLSEIKEIIAIYQGQATLGKIIMVLMHEGRKPLKYLKEQSPLIAKWLEDLKKQYDTNLLDKIIDRLGDTKSEANLLIELFNRLDPLAVKKRGQKKQVNVHKIVERIGTLFGNELITRKIEFTNEVEKNLDFFGWEQDLYVALTNLVDNSLYWLMQRDEKKQRQIRVFSREGEDKIIIGYKDNGPGIEQKNIENDIIFEPGFSTKPEGTGLGLAIAGEAIERNGGKLKAIYDPDGACFRIELPKEEKK